MNCRTAINGAKIAATYMGTVIGAGFASGQEIMQFFVSYGSVCFVSLVLAGCLFGWLGGSMLELGRQQQLKNYTQAFYYVCGPYIGRLLDILTTLFLFSGLTIMLAGAGTVCRDYLGLPFNLGIGLMAAATVLTVCFGLEGIAHGNFIAVPLLIGCTMLTGINSLLYHNTNPIVLPLTAEPKLQPAPHWLLACFQYVSYNLILAASVLVPLGAEIRNRNDRCWGSTLGGLFLTALALFIACVIVLHLPDIAADEVPMLHISRTQHPLSYVAYGITLIIALYTTAIASLYGSAAKLCAVLRVNRFAALLVITAASIALSQLGFSALIGALYPVFGYSALWFSLKLLWHSIQRKG